MPLIISDVQKLKHIQQDKSVDKKVDLNDIMSNKSSKTYMLSFLKNILPIEFGSGEKNHNINKLFVIKNDNM